jgi:hypothetical protein
MLNWLFRRKCDYEAVRRAARQRVHQQLGQMEEEARKPLPKKARFLKEPTFRL